jgi:hypothetical protein
MKTYTKEQVINLLVIAQMRYSKKSFIEGKTYGEVSNKILEAFDKNKNNTNVIISTVTELA